MACDRCVAECEIAPEDEGEDPLFPLLQPRLMGATGPITWPEIMADHFDLPRICKICGVVFCRPR